MARWELMTQKQADYLQVLCARNGREFDPELSKDEADEAIQSMAGLPAKLTRADVRTVLCPRCGARPGEPCRGTGAKPRASNHLERVAAARELGGTLIRGATKGAMPTADPFHRKRMTPQQKSFLRHLCEQVGEAFDESLSREEAREEIGRLKAAADDAEG
mgnify:CR=1 FL=1